MKAEHDRENNAARKPGDPAEAAGGAAVDPPAAGGNGAVPPAAGDGAAPPAAGPPAAGGAVTPPAASGGEVTRRGFFRFLGGTLGVAGGAAGLAGALSPLKDYDPSGFSAERFFQKHYKELNPGEKQKILERIEKEVWERYHVKATVGDLPPLPGVEFGYALNLGRCIGCRRCVYACVAENNQSRVPEIQYIRVLAMPRGSVDLERAEHHYDPPEVPDENHYYMPVQCHQCSNPPCVKVCPVQATWQEPDGVVVIDYDWCIGCRYCEAACPYWARRFNFTKPGFPDPEKDLNPRMNYLSNRPRTQGVMEKCHFCLHRTRAGRLPACVEVCPVGARKFGNLLDPKSEVSQILLNKHVFVLKQEVGTMPRFFYFFDQDYPKALREAIAGPAGGGVGSGGGAGTGGGTAPGGAGAGSGGAGRGSGDDGPAAGGSGGAR